MCRGFAERRVRQVRRRAAAPELFRGELRQQALRLTSDVDGDLQDVVKNVVTDVW